MIMINGAHCGLFNKLYVQLVHVLNGEQAFPQQIAYIPWHNVCP